MAQQKGKSQKIHQAIQNLEEALNEWDALSDGESADSSTPKANARPQLPDPKREKTLSLLEDLKRQLHQFDDDPEISH